MVLARIVVQKPVVSVGGQPAAVQIPNATPTAVQTMFGIKKNFVIKGDVLR